MQQFDMAFWRRMVEALCVLLIALASGEVAFAAPAPTDQAAIERGVESALFVQRPLLDQALARISPTDPKQIGMYFLGVAGDGQQEVFRREVEFVHQQFDRDFATSGRSLVLINSRSTVDRVPMATRLSLREALHTIAQRMDRNKDILFLFLTSHGSRDHQLSLAQLGMDLPSLSASELASMLKQQQIRWKVIVISACFAGGFIAPLQDDHTLIITAARADRSSFGCADDNDFTYFGRAFFKESLPRSASFNIAFEQAKRLVNQWEQTDRRAAPKGGKLLPSLPQIVSPAPIAAHLAAWRHALPRH